MFFAVRVISFSMGSDYKQVVSMFIDDLPEKSCCQWEVNILLLQIMIWSQIPVLSCFLSGPTPIIHWKFSVPLQWFHFCRQKILYFLNSPNTIAMKQNNWISEIRCPGFVETCLRKHVALRIGRQKVSQIEMHSLLGLSWSYSKALCLCKLNGLCLSFLLCTQKNGWFSSLL